MNSYFQFKQFRIEQGNCAMKISTDACIQGAWTPIADNVKNTLDIGTGTGLLSLMLAQRNTDIHIDAIELDIAAAKQAGENFHLSPWSERLIVIHTDAKVYDPGKQYDMIVCNPPFFQNSLLGPDELRNNARHTHAFEYADLIAVMERLLNQQGYASVILPATEHNIWEALLIKAGWNINAELQIQPLPHKAVNRIVSICSREKKPKKTDRLCIYAEQGRYTSEFTELLQPYYLQL